MSASTSIPGNTPNTGAAMTPAIAASAAPAANVVAKTRSMSTPSDAADEIDDHERNADREEDLIEMTSAQPPKQEWLDDKSERADEQRREHEREPEIPRALNGSERDVCAKHVERAVLEVDDIHHPEDEREPRGEDEKQGAERDAVQRLLDRDLDGHVRERLARHVVGFPGSVTRAILSTITFTA